LPTLISNEDFISLIKQYQQIIEENIKSQAGAYYKLLDHTLIIEGKQKSLRDCVLAGGSQYTRRADEYNRKSKEEQITTIYSTFLTSFVS